MWVIESESGRLRLLFAPQYLRSMAFLIGMYGIWNLCAGTLGFFSPYILHTVGGHSQAVSVMLQGAGFMVGIPALIFVFMRLVDRVNQRLLFGLSALSQIVGVALLAIFPLTVPTVVLATLVSAFGFTQAFYQLWSAELFPTILRSTAQGITFAVVRIGYGLWSFFVPSLASTDFSTLAWILTGFLIVSALIGVAWAPRNEGKSLEQIEADRNSLSSMPYDIAAAQRSDRSLQQQKLL